MDIDLYNLRNLGESIMSKEMKQDLIMAALTGALIGVSMGYYVFWSGAL